MNTRNIFLKSEWYIQEYLPALKCVCQQTLRVSLPPPLLVSDTMRSLALLLGVKAACILLVSSLSGTGAVNNSGRWW